METCNSPACPLVSASTPQSVCCQCEKLVESDPEKHYRYWRCPGISVQSRWPQIHWAKPLIEPQLLADKVNLPPYALPWKTQHRSVCTTVGERHSPQAVTHPCFSIRMSPRRAIHSNLIKVDSGRASPCLLFTCIFWLILQLLFS